LVLGVASFTGWSRAELHAMTVDELEDEAEGVLELLKKGRRRRGR
jgi:hypothetical protein